MGTKTDKAAEAVRGSVIDGLTVREFDGEPMVLATELAERLGYTHPPEVNRLIKRSVKEGKLSDSDLRVITTRCLDGLGRSRSTTKIWLNETGAVLISLSSRTETAVRICRQVVAVFIAWRHGRLGAANGNGVAELAKAFASVATSVTVLTAANTRHESLIAELLAASAKRDQRLDEIDATNAKRDEQADADGKRIGFLERHVAQNGHISQAQHESLRAQVRDLAELEHAIGKWPSVEAARRDIDTDMGRAAGWGGKSEPWRFLPLQSLPKAFVVLRRRRAIIMREARARARERQQKFDHVPDEPPTKKTTH